MLAALAVGLASGTGIYLIAAGATVFILGVLWLLESLEPEARKAFTLKIKGKDVDKLRSRVGTLLRGKVPRFEARTTGPDELAFEVSLPIKTRTDRLSNAILALDPDGKIEVEWVDQKDLGNVPGEEVTGLGLEEGEHGVLMVEIGGAHLLGEGGVAGPPGIRVRLGKEVVRVLDREGGDGVVVGAKESLEGRLGLAGRPGMGERVPIVSRSRAAAGEEPARRHLPLQYRFLVALPRSGVEIDVTVAVIAQLHAGVQPCLEEGDLGFELTLDLELVLVHEADRGDPVPLQR